jgi:uncharacterized damage-inducible protein DinB/quinol monooxygenase YgiN
MSQQISWHVELEVMPDAVEAFRELTADMVSAAAEEPGTLVYERFIDEDRRRAFLYERYADGAAAMAHLEMFNARYAARLRAMARRTRFILCGPASPELRAALASLNPICASRLDGFSRTPALAGSVRIRDYAAALAAYNSWMNDRIFSVSAELSDEERKRDLGAFFKSVHLTLNHLLLADQAWLQRFRGLPVTMISPAQELFDDFASLRAARRSMDDDIEAWVAHDLSAAWAAQPFAFYSVAYGKDRVIPGWAAVVHLFNHQTHHRGQVTALLKQLGKDPGVTDIPWMPYFD